jgi:hypothetical protein
MGFNFRNRVGVSCIVLFWGSIAAASSADRDIRRITVLVNDGAQVAPAVLDGAEIETARIFRAAGVEIEWIGCPSRSAVVEDQCHVIPGSNQFVLHIVPTGNTSSDLVFGLAFLGADGSGKYCDVFYDRIAEAHHESGVNLSLLLGMVAAHELGHLLLGSHAHSYMGIMTPVWRDEVLRRGGMGSLLFTSEQASVMKSRTLSQRVSLVRVGRGGGK